MSRSVVICSVIAGWVVCAWAVIAPARGLFPPWTRPKLRSSRGLAAFAIAATSLRTNPAGRTSLEGRFRRAEYHLARCGRRHSVYARNTPTCSRSFSWRPRQRNAASWFPRPGSVVYIGHDIGRPAVIEGPAPKRLGRLQIGPALQLTAGKPNASAAHARPAYRQTSRCSDFWHELFRCRPVAAVAHRRHRPKAPRADSRMMRNQLKTNIDGSQAYVSRDASECLRRCRGQPMSGSTTCKCLGHVPAQGTAQRPALPRDPSPMAKLHCRDTNSLAGRSTRTPTGNANCTASRSRSQARRLGSYRKWLRSISQGHRVPRRAVANTQAAWLQHRLVSRRAVASPLRQEASQPGACGSFARPPQPLLIASAGFRGSIGRNDVQPEPIGDDFRSGSRLESRLGRHERSGRGQSRLGPDQTLLADARRARPLICTPLNGMRAFSRNVNLLMIDRRPLGSEHANARLPGGAGCGGNRCWPVPGTPVWTTIQTQPSEGSAPSTCDNCSRLGSAQHRGPGTVAVIGLHCPVVRQPRPVVSLGHITGSQRPGNATARRRSSTAQFGT